jgi:hypothetical protein
MSADKIVTVKGVAALARANMWPYHEKTNVGILETGEPVAVYLGVPIVDMRPSKNSKPADGRD